MTDRVVASEKHLKRNEDHNFLNRIAALYEMWLRSYEPKLKSLSSEWHTTGQSRPPKFRQKQGNLKQLAITAYNNGGVLATDYVRLLQTVNGMYKAKFLQEKFRQFIRKKRLALSNV